MAMRIAEKLIGITDKLQIPFILKVRLRKQIVESIVFQELERKGLKILRKFRRHLLSLL
jgi:3-deoxy-D-manno-octulosonic acid (KDO) 8-phosphate synthase